MNNVKSLDTNQKDTSLSPAAAAKSPEKQTGEASMVDTRPGTAIQRRLQEMANDRPEETPDPIQRQENNTGLPDNLKSGIENLSGLAMDDVRVHRNSDKPTQLNAHAYAQGTDIHLAAGQEKHLPHEAWHVVQQKQGRVKPTLQMKGKVAINDDAGLEREADVMGGEAVKFIPQQDTVQNSNSTHKNHSKHSDEQLKTINPKSIQLRIYSSFSGQVIQRQLDADGSYKAGTQIKILEDEELKIVYLSRDWDGDDDVFYCEGRVFPGKKGKKGDKDRKPTLPSGEKEKRISSQDAFDISTRNTKVKAEKEGAEEAVELAAEMGEIGLILIYCKEVLVDEDTDGIYSAVSDAHMIKVLKTFCNENELNEDFPMEDDAQQQRFIDDFLKNEEWGFAVNITDYMARSESRTAGEEDAIAAAAGAKSSKPDWKTQNTKNNKTELLREMTGTDDITALIKAASALHHKISKARFKTLLSKLGQSPPSDGKQEMSVFLQRIKGLTGVGDDKKAIDNWSANLEIGPQVRAEGDDEGSEFEGNYLGGTATPRTQELEKVDEIIAGGDPKTMDWSEVARLLNTVQNIHESTFEAKKLSTPVLAQWHQGEGGISRDKKQV